MKILIVTQYFYPEDFKINEIAKFLVQSGYDVSVLTSVPNYPFGKIYDGYTMFNKRFEALDGIKIYRAPTIPRGNGSISLMLNYISFVFSSLFYSRKIRKNNYDIILGNQLSPITSMIAGIYLKRKSKIPMVLWVLDLWPESFYGNFSFRVKLIDRFIKKLSSFIYSNTDHFLVSSKSFEKEIRKKIKRSVKFDFFPNWAEDIYFERSPPPYPYTLPIDGFNIVFAGNMGDSQGFEDLIDIIKMDPNNGINWILVGDGRKKDWLLEQKQTYSLNNLYLHDRVDLKYIPSLYHMADALFLTLKNTPVFANTLPGKFQGYLSSGKPILGNVSGEGKKFIEEYKIGYVNEPGNPRSLMENALKISKLTQEELKEIEIKSKSLLENSFNKEMILKSLQTILHNQIN